MSGGRYRSLFPDRPPLEVDEAALHAVGRPGGPCEWQPTLPGRRAGSFGLADILVPAR
jgi:hypothetical protein